MRLGVNIKQIVSNSHWRFLTNLWPKSENDGINKRKLLLALNNT